MIVVKRNAVLADRASHHGSALVRVGAEGPSATSGVAISLLAVALVVVLLVV